MPVPFGISIGDFIALINVTVTIVNALKDSTGSTKEYQDVVRELESLSLALINVRDIKTDRTELKAALTSVVSNCGRTVQDFLNKIRRFEVSLGTPGCSRRKFRDGLRKIQWALYSKDDIRSFQMELYSHTASLNILLTQVNHIMSSAAQQEHQRALNDHSQALIRIESKLGQERIGASTMQVMILSAITQCLSEFRSLVAFILFSNLKLISCVVEASRIPPQVTFEKPVVFEDAHGRILPVQMVWIKSWENFETMLKMGFSDVPGLSLIKRGEYVLTDVHSKTDLQKTRPIQTAFRPGRKINMSMTFLGLETQNCPKCDLGEAEAKSKEKESCCMNCGLFYSRFRISPTTPEPATESDVAYNFHTSYSEEPQLVKLQDSDQSRGSYSTDCVSDFARVRIFEVTEDEETREQSAEQDADVLIFTYKGRRHTIHFPVHSLATLRISHVQERIARRIDVPPRYIALFNKGRRLEDMSQECCNEGVEHMSELFCEICLSSSIPEESIGYRVVERYSVCRCLYYKHPIDYAIKGRHDHRIQERTVLVGYTCSNHSRRSLS